MNELPCWAVLCNYNMLTTMSKDGQGQDNTIVDGSENISPLQER